MVAGSNAELLRSHITRRNPALVVLAYGTNEARRPDLSYEGVRDDLLALIRIVRAASPTAAILVVGAPDQVNRTRRAPIGPAVETVLRAQRDAALASGCGFWNLRAAMGGSGSMKQWVQAGLAQKDWVHLTAPGYRLVGDSLYELIMGQYGIFETVRSQVLGGRKVDRRATIISLIQQVTKKSDVPAPDESLFDSGLLDSFALPDLVSALEESFGLQIPDSDLTPRKFESIERIEQYLDSRK